MKRKILAFVDLHLDSGLDALTVRKSTATTTVFGRYTFIDFVLTNLHNSGIDQIGVLVKDNFLKVIKHIKHDSTYLENSKTGSFEFLVDEKGLINNYFNTDVSNIKANDFILFDSDADYVIIAPTQFMYHCDFADMVEKHIKSGKRISVLYKKANNYRDFTSCDKVTIDTDGNVAVKFSEINSRSNNFNVCLETYIVDKSLFMGLIDQAQKISAAYNIPDLIKNYSSLHEINALEVTSEVRCFNSLRKYFVNSMRVLDNAKYGNLLGFDEQTIFTCTHNSIPVVYDENAVVKESIIANGCKIAGTVNHSILARDVIVEEGAVVENCVLFSHTIVKKGVHLKNVVCNKRVTFANKKNVIGESEKPIFVERGSII